VLEDARGRFSYDAHKSGFDCRTRRIAPGVQHASPRMRGLKAAGEFPDNPVNPAVSLNRAVSVSPVELDAESNQILDALRPLGAQRLDGLDDVESRAGAQRVVDMRGDAVLGEDRSGDPALRIEGITLGQFRLGHESDRVRGARGDRGHESRDPAADDDDARHVRPPSSCSAWLQASVRVRCERAR
jgi:hypothetical protein